MSTETNKRRLRRRSDFAVCVDNSGYPASLELHKIYRVILDPSPRDEEIIRVIDESGEDYLYDARRFVAIDVPPSLRTRLLCHLSGGKRAAPSSRTRVRRHR